MKRLGILLALLVLFGSLLVGTGSVRAATSEWYVVVPYPIDTVQGWLDSTWLAYTPQVVGIEGDNQSTTVYFASEQDLARFLLPASLQGPPIGGFMTAPYRYKVIYLDTNDIKDFNTNTYQLVIEADNTSAAWGAGWVGDSVTTTLFHIKVETYEGSQQTKDGSTQYIFYGGSLYVRLLYQDDMVDKPSRGQYFYLVYRDDGKTVVSFGNAVVSSPTVTNITTDKGTAVITFSLKDALTGQGLTGVTVKDSNGSVLGMVDDGGTLELMKGTHTLTFEKTGYWSITKTIDVQSDMSISVEMYPDTTSVMISVPDNLRFFEHSTGSITLTISPIETSATYDAYLELTGLSGITEVEKNGHLVNPDSSGRYYLGDITNDTSVLIRFKTGSVGTYAFTATVTSSDAAGVKSYTTSKQISFNVDPLPFSIQMPSEWQVGQNELRVSEASGQSYSLVVVLKNSAGSQVWSDSYAFSPYDVHIFNVQVPEEGDYTLEFQWGGTTAEFQINVGVGIQLLTQSMTVREGDIATIQVKLKNPSDSTKYYTVEVSGGFLDAVVNQSFAVPPATEKTVSLAIQVPEHLQYDAYDLDVVVKEGDAVKYSGKVHVIIEGGGFSLFSGGGSGGSSTLLLLGGGLLVAGLMVAMAKRRR